MTRARAAKPHEAMQFAQAMADHFHARIAKKSDAVEWQMVTAAVRAATFGLVDVDELLRDYSTSIGPLIYLRDGLGPDEMIEVVTHECEHVCQFWRGGFSFAWLYLAEPEARAKYEAQAYAAGLEVLHARFGAIPPLQELAMPLEGGAYLLTKEMQAFGRRILEQRASQVAGGVYTSQAGRHAIELLQSMELAPVPGQ